jgi:endonuclease YncB( thermonuclease family)
MGICYTKTRTVNKNKDNFTNINIDEVPMIEHLFKNVTKTAKIVDIYDGDTFTAMIKLFDNQSSYVKIKTRTYGYDCPEMKPSTKNKDRDNEKRFAQLSKRVVSDMILNKVVKLDCMGYDKYGRLLCKVIFDYNKTEICLNDWMVINSYGYSYKGDKKPDIEYYDKHYIVSFKCKDGTVSAKKYEPNFDFKP